MPSYRANLNLNMSPERFQQMINFEADKGGGGFGGVTGPRRSQSENSSEVENERKGPTPFDRYTVPTKIQESDPEFAEYKKLGVQAFKLLVDSGLSREEVAKMKRSEMFKKAQEIYRQNTTEEQSAAEFSTEEVENKEEKQIWYDGIESDIYWSVARLSSRKKDPRDITKRIDKTPEEIEKDRNKQNQARERLEQAGIDADLITQLSNDQEARSQIIDAVNYLQNRRRNLNNKNLTEDEAKAILSEKLGVSKSESTQEPKAQVEIRPEKKHKTDEDEENSGEKPRGNRWQNEFDTRMAAIEDYPTEDKFEALKHFKTKLVRDGAPAEYVQRINNLLKSFGESEIVTPEKINEKIEECYKELGKIYDTGRNMINLFSMTLYENELTKALTELEKMGPLGKEEAETMKEEFLTIGTLHDLRLMVNSRTSVDENMLKYASELKGREFDRLIHLQNRTITEDAEGKDYVTRYLAAIDEEARRIYNRPVNSKGKPEDGTDGYLKLEDPKFERKILDTVKADRVFYLIARDLYRVTGGEARYAVEGRATTSSEKGGSWIIDSNGDKNNGAFFRTALNMRRSCAGAVDSTSGGKFVSRYWPELWRHLDPGVASFWEKIWKEANKQDPDDFTYQTEIRLDADIKAGIPPRKYAILTTNALRKIKLGVEKEEGKPYLENEIGFNIWMEETGKVGNTMLKELAFMGSPTFKSFQSTLGSDYFPIIIREREYGKVNRDQYLLERVGDLTDYYLNAHIMTTEQIAKELEEYRNSRFLFKSDEDLLQFMKDHKIPTEVMGKVTGNMSNMRDRLLGRHGQVAQKKAREAVGGAVGKAILDEIIKTISK